MRGHDRWWRGILFRSSSLGNRTSDWRMELSTVTFLVDKLFFRSMKRVPIARSREYPALLCPGEFTAHLAVKFYENSPWRPSVDRLLNKAITMRPPRNCPLFAGRLHKWMIGRYRLAQLHDRERRWKNNLPPFDTWNANGHIRERVCWDWMTLIKVYMYSVF